MHGCGRNTFVAPLQELFCVSQASLELHINTGTFWKRTYRTDSCPSQEALMKGDGLGAEGWADEDDEEER